MRLLVTGAPDLLGSDFIHQPAAPFLNRATPSITFPEELAEVDVRLKALS